MLVLSFQILQGMELQQNPVLWVVLGAAVLLPIILSVSVGIQLFRLVKDQRQKVPGAGYRMRILIGFFVLILFAALPQSMLSLNFMRIAVDTWFRPEIGEALEGGLNLAVEYYQQEARRLEDFADSDLLKNVVRGAVSEPGRTLDLIRQLRPELSAIQIVANSGVQLAAYGEPEQLYEPGLLLREAPGRLVRAALENRDVLRIKVLVPSAADAQGALLLSLEIASNFDVRARNLQTNLGYFTQFAANQNLFTFAVLLFYGFFAVPLILVALLVSFYFSDQMIYPIVSLEAATRKVAEGDFSFRILSRRKEDLDVLTTSFNSMVSELERSRNKLVHSERVAAWKDMAQRLAHEIKNPLTPIKLSAERMVWKYNQGAENFGEILTQATSTIITEVDRLALMLTEFRNFARLPNPEPEEFLLLPEIHEVRDLYNEYPNIRIDISGISDDSIIYGDRKQIRQVLENLIKNGIEACSHEGIIRLGAYKVTKADREYCRIMVEDNGEGIPEGVEIFTPYFTSKETGTGLGLAIVERIVADHGGNIFFETVLHEGTRFYVDFPF